MPPPTVNIASVPATDRNFISHGAATRMPRPSAANAAPFLLRYRPRSSSLTMAATRPYTPMVIARAIATSTATCWPNDTPATTPSDSTMISADRMKSVRIAPLTLSFSSATTSTF